MPDFDQWRKRIVDRAPLPLLTQAHEVFLAVAVFLIAVGLIVGEVDPESVSGQVPVWIRNGWALALFTGSVSTIWGLFTNRPLAEWVGQTLLGWGTFFYALAILTSTTFSQGGVVALIFLGLAGVSWWRAFKIKSAPFIQYRLTKAARAAHVEATKERRSET